MYKSRLYEASNVGDCEQTFHLFSLTSGSHLAIEPPQPRTPQHNPHSRTPSYVPNTPYSPSPYSNTTPSRSPYPSSSTPYDTSRSPYHCVVIVGYMLFLFSKE